MTTFEEKVNAYRENKRLLEELEAMAQGTAKAIYKDVQSVRLDSKLLKTLHPDVYAECSTRTSYKRFSVV